MTKSWATVIPMQRIRKLNTEPPMNEDRKQGYALVNVLGRKAFRSEHIRHSINIPTGQEELELFEKFFDKNKENILFVAPHRAVMLRRIQLAVWSIMASPKFGTINVV